jgi:hypothetical protein
MLGDNEAIGDAEAIIREVEELAKPVEIIATRGTEQTATVVALPKGKTLHSLKPFVDEYLKRPERKKGNTRLTTLDAFCAFANRHSTSNTVVFLDDTDADAPRLRAVFNAHETELDQEVPLGGELVATASRPDWQDFTADYAFPLSDEWKAWTSLPPQFSMLDFALFLEDRITDVVDPFVAGDITKKFIAELGVKLATGARLMELSRGLKVNVDLRVAQHQNLSSGESALHFSEEHKDAAGAALQIPGAFLIAIPVFRLGALYQIPVRLRYRIIGGKVVWSLSPQRTDRVFEHALEEAEGKVASAVARPIFRGRIDR